MAAFSCIEIATALLFFLFLILILSTRTREAIVLPIWHRVQNFPSLLANFHHLHDFGTEVLKKYDGTFEFKGPFFANMDFVATCDPMNIQHILQTNFVNYPKGEKFRQIFEPLGDGILNSDGDLWRDQRKMFQMLVGRQSKFEVCVAKTIHQKVVDGLIPVLDRVSETGIQVDLQEVFGQLTFDTMFSLIFGIDPISHSFKLSNLAYQKAFEDIEEAILQRHFLPESFRKLQNLLQFGSEGKLRRAWKALDELSYECISIKRQKHQNQSKTQKEEANFDLITAYLEEEERKGESVFFRFPDKFLRDTAINFMGAGRASINAALTWFFFLIATNPNVETKILEEIKENFRDKEGGNLEFMSAQELNKLVYLHASLCETLRLYPSIPFNHKSANEEDILPSGHHIKRNMTMLISFYSMGRMEAVWGEDCLEFKPERWISKEGRVVYFPSNKFSAFNTGPRTCLGKDMAFIQMKAVAVAVLSNYCVHVVEGHPVSPSLSMVLHMKYGLKVRVSTRYGR
ncbi:hypothetical protein UlMin_022392 [Ulmus minor]